MPFHFGEEIINTVLIDGSGWTSVTHNRQTGLVPTSYIEILPPSTAPLQHHERPRSSYSNSSVTTGGSNAGASGAASSSSMAGAVAAAIKKKGPAVAPKRGAKKLKYVEALYDYEARSEMEWSFQEGDKFVLAQSDQGDGWAEVERGGVVKSVPASYVKEV